MTRADTPQPSRHEKQHPKPVLTCPVCIWRLAGDIVWRKVSR